MNKIFRILLISFTFFLSNYSKATQDQEYEEEYRVTVYNKKPWWWEGRQYSFYLKPSESVTVLFGLIADKFGCKITDLLYCDVDTRCHGCRYEYGIVYPKSNNFKLSEIYGSISNVYIDKND